MEYKDYYQTLGVAKTASAEEIKKAYRKLMRKHHPDVSRASDADHKTKEINEAYAVLGDAEKRAAYDALGEQWQAGQQFQPPPDWGMHGASSQRDFGAGGFDPDDFFADLFSHVGRRSQQGGFARHGEDVHATINVSLNDIYHGAVRAVTVRVPGQGGHSERRASVNIPRGVLPGQQLRVAGQGQPGSGGAPAGDLVLEVQLRPEARYRVEGRQVTARLPVAPWEAALGASIEVPTPSGPVTVTVPAGSQNGRKLRLKGRGIPGSGAEAAGNLLLELEVVLPPATTTKARELYETMARELAFNPRDGMRQ